MVGIDIEKIDRFDNWSDCNLKRVFSNSEIEYAKKFNNSNQHICGFYCVKEALVKAIDKKNLKFSEIEILHTSSGKPFINKNAYIVELLNQNNCKDFEISISHNQDYAVAIVMLIK